MKNSNFRKFGRALSSVAATVSLACSTSVFASTIYFDFNANLGASSTTASLFLFGEADQSVSVSNNEGFDESVILNSDGFFDLSIPNTYQQSGTGIRNSGFRVVSADPLGAYFVNRSPQTTDMTYLLDSEGLGTEYVVSTHGAGHGEGSQVMIHAVEDGTNVTFSPKGAAPISVVLNAGETYKYAGGLTDLTGSTVSASSDVAVFGGHACADIPTNAQNYCDSLIEQMIPTDKLSKSYMLTASLGAEVTPLNSDLVKVVATVDGTEVSVDGGIPVVLNEGDVYEFSLAENSGALVEATEAIMVAQYLKGGNGTLTDPAFALVPGLETWLSAYRLATPDGSAAFELNYASIVIDELFASSLMLDGLSVDLSGFSSIGSTGYLRGIVDLPLGLFDLTADDPFLVMLGGGENADSYFTYGGATFALGISPPDPVDPVDPVVGVSAPATIGLMLLGIAGICRSRRRIA